MDLKRNIIERYPEGSGSIWDAHDALLQMAVKNITES